MALEKTNSLGKIQVVGFDTDPATLAGIEAGTVYATIMQDEFGTGFHTVRILAENARGDRSGLPMFQRNTLPVEPVTKYNVAGVRAKLEGRPMPPSTQPVTSSEPTT
jgi:ABC-type sugar transport system substrate-binding protein